MVRAKSLRYSIACLLEVFSIIPFALTINDWSTPCLRGHCAYDFPPDPNAMGRTLMISGASDAISDITPAAGWAVLDCLKEETGTSHAIRIICDGPEELCGHLLQGRFENKVVRLPEECENLPFAHITYAEWDYDAADPRKNFRGKRRNEVLRLVVDFDFRSISPSIQSPISFMIIGSTLPREAIDKALASGSNKRSATFQGGFTDYNIKEAVAELQAFAFGSFASDLSITFPKIEFNETVLLFNQTLLNADGETIAVEGTSSALADIQMALGVVAKGQLIPPGITDLGIFAALSGDIGGGLDFAANAAGIFDTNVTLYSKPLPGLDIHGILSIDPIFAINTNILATTDFDVSLSTNISYHVRNLGFAFPPAHGTSSVAAYPREASLRFSANPVFAENATFEMHLIPSLSVGLTVPGLVSTTVSLAQDVYSKLYIGFDAEASTSSSANNPIADKITGCATLYGGLDLSAGADGSFLDIFDNNTMISILSEDAVLLQKCFMRDSI